MITNKSNHMKTIEISNEMYDRLVALATEMTDQDPRCTKMPHLFQIKTTEQVAAYDGCGEEKWFNDEGGEITDIDEYLMESNDWTTNKIGDLDEYVKESELEKINCSKHNVTTEHKYQNCFFTAKACQEHIKSNHYHYNEPVDYLNHAWRNPEMELVSEFLCGLVGKKPHK